MEAVWCIRLGDLRGLVPIPYVALQDTGCGPLGGKPSGPAGGGRRAPWVCQESDQSEPSKRPAPAGVRSPADRMFM